jgi:hypothetical protein
MPAAGQHFASHTTQGRSEQWQEKSAFLEIGVSPPNHSFKIIVFKKVATLCLFTYL